MNAYKFSQEQEEIIRNHCKLLATDFSETLRMMEILYINNNFPQPTITEEFILNIEKTSLKLKELDLFIGTILLSEKQSPNPQTRKYKRK